MEMLLKRDWLSTVQIGAVCASLALLGAIVVGLF